MLHEGRVSCERAVVQSRAFVPMELMGYGGLMTERMRLMPKAWGGGCTEFSPHSYKPSVSMTNSKQIPNMPINWHGASSLLPGLILGLNWGQNGLRGLMENVQVLQNIRGWGRKER